MTPVGVITVALPGETVLAGWNNIESRTRPLFTSSCARVREGGSLDHA